MSLFLSDVETDTWSEQEIQDVTAASGRVIVTLGEKGAVLHEDGNISRIPVTQVWMYKCMDVWIYGCMHVQVDVWMYGCMDI